MKKEFLRLRDFCLFYKIDKLVKDFKSMETILERFELPDLVTYIESVDWIMVGEIRSDFVLSMTKLLKEAISFFFETASIDSYDIKVGDIVEDRKYLDEDGGHIDVDGVRVQFEDGWALVRASNTGPNLTIRYEATTEERLEEIKKEFNTIVDELLVKYGI